MRPRQDRIEPLALVLLIAFVLLPPALLFGPDLIRRLKGPPEPLYTLHDRLPKQQGAALPTKGMSLSADGFGTVLKAPSATVVMDDTRTGYVRGGVRSDVAIFVRSWPGIALNPKIDRSVPRVCAWNGEEWQGRVVLHDGCLRFQPADGTDEMAVLPVSGLLFRDDTGYLALGDPADPGQFQVRIGEPDVVVRTGSCTFPETISPPSSYRAVCGSDVLLVALSIERRPMCSSAFLADRARLEREESATAARIKAEAEACHASGRKACPPATIPRSPPLTEASAPCRVPAAYRSSHRSSTQP